MLKLFFLLILIVIGCPFQAWSQSDYISNPSFEGYIGGGNIPPDWTTCNQNSTPDTQPLDAKLSPTDGSSYLGLVIRGSELLNDPKNEDVVTKLLRPLKKDTTYILSVDLACAPYEFDITNFGRIYYNNSPRLRISVGNSSCTTSEILTVSEFITNTKWKRYYFPITPKLSSYNYLKLEVYLQPLVGAYLLLDNLKIENFYIRGKSEVCKGQKKVSYSVFPQKSCLSNINWKYSGSGANISTLGDSITIDYASNATNGILTATFNNCGFRIDTVKLPISLSSPISETGTIISGSTYICGEADNIFYSTLPIGGANNYTWTYSGMGATIAGNSENITMNFLSNAASGNLVVVGNNACGAGPPSEPFPIKILHKPGDVQITGTGNVCKGQNMVKYFTSPASDAKNYVWNYDGTGSTIIGDRDTIYINFSQESRSGNLTVMAQNECSAGNISPKFPIIVDSLPDAAGIIHGEKEVCSYEGKINYSVPPINNTTTYIWNYTGKGASFTENSNRINVDFSETATGGSLTVTGSNHCGLGATSQPLPVSVVHLPSNAETIIGPEEVCTSERTTTYSIPSVKNATEYVWAYTGSGIDLNSKTDSIKIDFSKGATNGILSVAGKNRCGIGMFSPDFPISIDTCDQSPRNLNIPNCFSPNGDGMNDQFVIRGLKKNARFMVFDNYGKTLFQSDNYQNDWNGVDLEGKFLPTNTYWYVLIFPKFSIQWKGFIYLKR